MVLNLSLPFTILFIPGNSPDGTCVVVRLSPGSVLCILLVSTGPKMVRSNTGLRTSRLMIYIVAIRKLAERKSIRKPVSKQIIAITAKPFC